jgi:hypothetical protein
VFTGAQRGEINLARGGSEGGERVGAERVAGARVRVEPDEEPRRAREVDVERRLAPELEGEEDGLEGARAVGELAAEADADGRAVARDAQWGRRGGIGSGVLLEDARGVERDVLACVCACDCRSRDGGIRIIRTSPEHHRLWGDLYASIFYEALIFIGEFEEGVRFRPADEIVPRRETGRRDERMRHRGAYTTYSTASQTTE